jgi:hypothetical protein
LRIARPETFDNCTIRLSRLMETINPATDANMKAWVRFWSNVAADNAPWDPSRISAQKMVPRWKRDQCLYGPGIACRMKRNRNFTSHVAASIARDAVNSESAESLLKADQDRLLSEYRENAGRRFWSLIG